MAANQTFSITNSISRAFSLFFANIPTLIKLYGTYFLISISFGVIASISGAINQHLTSLFSLINFLMIQLLFLGLFKACLMISREETVSVSILFSEFKLLPKYLVVAFITFISITLGYLLFILPGIYLSLRFMLVNFILVDRPDLGIGGLLSETGSLTKGVKLKLLGFLILLILINLVGLIPLGTGLLVTLPVSFIALAVVYTSLADDQPQTTPTPDQSTGQQPTSPAQNQANTPPGNSSPAPTQATTAPAKPTGQPSQPVQQQPTSANPGGGQPIPQPAQAGQKSQPQTTTQASQTNTTSNKQTPQSQPQTQPQTPPAAQGQTSAPTQAQPKPPTQNQTSPQPPQQ